MQPTGVLPWKYSRMTGLTPALAIYRIVFTNPFENGPMQWLPIFSLIPIDLSLPNRRPRTATHPTFRGKCNQGAPIFNRNEIHGSRLRRKLSSARWFTSANTTAGCTLENSPERSTTACSRFALYRPCSLSTLNYTSINQ